MNCASKSQAFKTWKKNNSTGSAGEFCVFIGYFSCAEEGTNKHVRIHQHFAISLKKYIIEHSTDQIYWNFIS